MGACKKSGALALAKLKFKNFRSQNLYVKEGNVKIKIFINTRDALKNEKACACKHFLEINVSITLCYRH